jgi:cytochrome c553
MNSRTATTRLAGVTIALVFSALFLAAGSAWHSRAAAQEGTAPGKDYNQRALEIYEFRKAAKSGPDRGQEIFYYKCWFCHNEFTKDIPKLTGLFQRAALITGAPMGEEAVKNQIRNGSANMAAYKYSLSEADLNDLVSYLKEKCCWNSDAPPPNPRYIAR